MMAALVHILRPINLLIVGLSQLVIYYLYLLPLFQVHTIVPTLTPWLIALFVIDTLLIAGAGYIINDILDISVDLQNKPTKTYIQEGKLNMNQAWYYYFALTIIGLIIAVYIAITIDKPHLIVIYPIACGLLYMYSYQWKAKPLYGNIVVAIFCAFVPGIIWYAEQQGMDQLLDRAPEYVYLLLGYILFGFFITLAREIIKDIEDIEGDRAGGFRTFPIAAGVDRAKVFAIINIILGMGTYIIWLVSFYKIGYQVGVLLTFFMLLLPTAFIMFRISRAKEKSDYTKLSQSIKLIMIASLIVFISTTFII